ncbi:MULTISPECIES: hypothetical protein [unclassified Pseudomonas]|uniref:hypothetical protein n=1 Tax=unclassified Pseudomonas TaxID=196821 RepID=UPI000C2FED1C|nr:MULTISPECIES: hypothetical protein [unclassified Pseudomonas]MCU1737664.1 hypothetical protein [Pseudomonas sp. 20S_6.2_Bac1]
MYYSKGRIILASAVFVAVAGLGYAWQKNLLQGDVFDWGREPLIRTQPASEESLHVEYPTVYNVSDGTAMLYSAYGDDHRWRIKLALAQTATDYVKQGNIFDENKLPFKGGYAFPFVRNTRVDGATVFELYFSAVEDGEPTYSAIYRATSADGLHWDVPKKLMSDKALDPLVIKQNGREIILYTSTLDGENVIQSAELKADGSVGPVHTVFNPHSGLYTLGVVHVDNKPVLVVETEHNWEALCFNTSGDLISASQEPIFNFKETTEKAWDGLKYGMYFFEGAATPTLYYNGIEAHGAEQGGQIGVGSYDPDSLASRLNLAQCQ